MTTVQPWIDDELKRGVPRWHIYKKLSHALSETEDLKKMQALSKAMQSIEHLLVKRNRDGIALEKEGKEEKAISLYEENVLDCFDGAHPYDRLRKLYKKRGDHTNLIRVCEAFLKNGSTNEKLCKTFRSEIEKIRSST